jgi:peptidoglycan hydrolase-like protein with peptidoglycan-binding domain
MKTGINNAIKTGLVALGFFGILATTANAAYFDNAPAYTCDVQITRQLGIGSEGVEVTVLQNFLNRAGYLSATPNGHFGPATMTAVRAFQANNYISATGTVGPMTRNAINERMCDPNLSTDSYNMYTDAYYNYGSYGYADGTTYVSSQDPFVTVVTPPVTNPIVYTNPQNVVSTPTYAYTNGYANGNYTTTNNTVVAPAFAPASSNGIASTNVIYSPSIGYTYGITPASGSLTITNPRANASYTAGDTVSLSWTTSNLSANGYTILLENTSTNQSVPVTTTTGNSVSFVLTQDLLNKVCGGACSSYTYGSNLYQGSFRFVVTTPYRDIAGNVTTFRAAVSPITIFIPTSTFGTVSITTNKNPVSSNDVFKLYVNIPTGAGWNANLYGQYSFKIRANCPAGVTASIAGVQCGNDFVIPFAPAYFQSEIPASIVNTSWFRQDVTFTLTVTNLAGQTIGTSQATVTANAAPFSW